jgi:hypothetical protein
MSPPRALLIRPVYPPGRDERGGANEWSPSAPLLPDPEPRLPILEIENVRVGSITGSSTAGNSRICDQRGSAGVGAQRRGLYQRGNLRGGGHHPLECLGPGSRDAHHRRHPGTAEAVSATFELFGVACPRATACEAVGFNYTVSGSLEGVIVTISKRHAGTL